MFSCVTSGAALFETIISWLKYCMWCFIVSNMNLDNMSLDKVELIDGKECCMDIGIEDKLLLSLTVKSSVC